MFPVVLKPRVILGCVIGILMVLRDVHLHLEPAVRQFSVSIKTLTGNKIQKDKMGRIEDTTSPTVK